ncbi:MAG TPA: tripartite tricarboxylate transporter substrate binding protein [Roseomonas sp.]|jgi:tripartite-type tricarboxylate transporter receptor subunit TctC
MPAQETPIAWRRRAWLRAATLGLAAPLLPRAAFAADFPTRPVRIIVPYAPGGAVDTLARRMAQQLTGQLGQSFVVENKSGASGIIGTAEVARSAPDGYTLLALENTYTTLPYVFNNLPFDHANGFSPITLTAISPVLMIVGAHSPYRDLAALLDAARRQPGKLTFGSGGVGSSLHLSAEVLQQTANVSMLHVTYRGGGEAVRAAIAGEVDFVMTSPGSSLSGIQGGLLRGLAICGRSRAASLPDVPTFAEAGQPGIDISNWSGLAAPRGTPQPVIDILYQAMVAALRSADMAAFLTSLASSPGGMPPAEFAAMIRRESTLWGEVARRAAIERQ